jgi:hypothetical protein
MSARPILRLLTLVVAGLLPSTSQAFGLRKLQQTKCVEIAWLVVSV